MRERVSLVKREERLSIRRQCELLDVRRSRVYYKGKGESEKNRKLMKLILEKFEEDPTYGVRRMTAYLRRLGYVVNHKRVERLMRVLGVRGVCPGRKTTRMDKEFKPENLMKRFKIRGPNDVWFMDISYVRVKGGFGYVAAVVDGYSRKVLALKVSNRMSGEICFEAVDEAVRKYGVPKVLHSDRGTQFTSRRFRVYLEERGIRSSFGERGFRDNILVERFWRTYKYECLYLREVRDLKDVKEVTKEWVKYYNGSRLHQALGYRTPDEVYYGGRVEVFTKSC
jgi:putative transposase